MFGCACYPHLRPYTPHKLAPRSTECIFLGYPMGTKGYLCLDLTTKCLYTSRHVIFNESKFPYSLLNNSSSPSSLPPSSFDLSWFSNLLYLHSTNQPSLLGPFAIHSHSSSPVSTASTSDLNPLSPSLTSNISLSPSITLPTLTSQPTSHYDTLPTSTPSLSLPSSDSLPVIPSIQPLSTTISTNCHPMQTRSKCGITKPYPKICYKAVLDYSLSEPPSYKVASQYPKWCEAMDTEFQALQRQQT